MESFKAIYRRFSYQVRVRGLNVDGDILDIKFDTGAVNTIVSLEAITDRDIDKKRLITQLEGKTENKVFRSASGNDMTGYLVCAESIKISAFVLQKFFYYLVTNVNVNVALLGDDFISHCTFWHDNQADIIVKSFDSMGYESSFNSSIDKYVINSILETCEK